MQAAILLNVFAVVNRQFHFFNILMSTPPKGKEKSRITLEPLIGKIFSLGKDPVCVDIDLTGLERQAPACMRLSGTQRKDS